MIEYSLSEKEKKEIKKVLVIQTAFIGDAILSTTIFKGIKKILPNVSLDVLAIPQTSNLFLNNPNIVNVYEFDKRKLLDRIKAFFKVLSQIKNNKYDLAISIQSSFTSSILMRLGGIKFRIGYPRQKLLTHTIRLKKGLHIRKRVLRLLEPLSVKTTLNDETELFWGRKESDKISKIAELENSDLKIAIAPGSAQFTKQWPKGYFGKLVKKLEGNNIQVFLLGGKEDKVLCDEIIRENNLKCPNLSGELTLLDSAALINKVDLVISNDSAPLHISNAVKTDVFAIFGPTAKGFGFYPYRENDKILEVELDCRPCGKHGGDKCPLGHFKCMIDLTPEMVFEEVKNKLLK
jgi:lipopolysaccharide heptosyltransferase II